MTVIQIDHVSTSLVTCSNHSYLLHIDTVVRYLCLRAYFLEYYFVVPATSPRITNPHSASC